MIKITIECHEEDFDKYNKAYSNVKPKYGVNYYIENDAKETQ